MLAARVARGKSIRPATAGFYGGEFERAAILEIELNSNLTNQTTLFRVLACSKASSWC